MKAVRKKRGWVYRGALAAVTAMAVTLFILWIASATLTFAVDVPISSNASLGISIAAGSFNSGIDLDVRPMDHGLPVGDMASPSWLYVDRHMVEPFRWLEYGMYHYKRDTVYGLWFPAWLLAVTLSIWPIIATIEWIRSKSVVGLCTACGYDLRGSKASTNCPECGEAIPRPASEDAASE